MKVIEQSHEIISLPENLLQIIEVAGRTCYKSEDKIGCIKKDNKDCLTADWDAFWDRGEVCGNTKCKDHSSQQFVTRMRDRGHHAMIEFGDIIVRFVTNRGVTHELVRHRLCSFAQESTRYVRYDGKMEFIRPCWWDESSELKREHWKRIMQHIEDHYCLLLSGKDAWRPEQAREVLPNSLKTEIVVKANVREWRHIFLLRCSKKAHPQIRALMLPLLAELKAQLPLVFEDIDCA
ncbi:FAD-dependent thymidylate synthase [Desulfotignum balticum]|uniref:FAD-dependent thymidylate synthase n=1 Tax=Desulfotignum balticum TaxID=115781 RepID=UPI00041341B0|nr:FAD-dependent thymidylate synthase [Desulfotignum balticum]